MPELSPEDQLLVTRFLQGDLSPAEQEDFAQRLGRSRELRKHYLTEATLVNMLRELPADSLSHKKSNKNLSRWFPAIGLAAAAGILAAFFFPRTAPGSPPALSPQQAAIKSLSGALLVDGKPAQRDAVVSAGQTVQLKGALSSANLTFADGSQFLLTGNSKLTLLDGAQKQIEMESGIVRASITKQQKRSPLVVLTEDSRVEIPESDFTLQAGESETRLLVSNGNARCASRSAQRKSHTVRAGQEFISARGGTVSNTPPPSASYSWHYDFEMPSHGNYLGKPITEGLPSGSQGGALAIPYYLDRMGKTFYQIGFRDQVAGLCETTDNSHLEMTFRSAAPYWFNTFIHAIDLREGHLLDYKIFKLDPKLLSRRHETRDQWHRADIPLSAFRERGDGSFNGPPLGEGLLITTLYVGTPAPERGLSLDDIAIHSDGSGELVLEPLAH